VHVGAPGMSPGEDLAPNVPTQFLYPLLSLVFCSIFLLWYD
jgi:hypothetical protein